MQTPTLRQLEYVVAVADAGQFVEAARRCGVSQPALSRQVRDVEDLLGVVLFERARPRVLLTPVGDQVVRRARRLLIDARELVEAARASAHVRAGTVRLGVIPSIAPYGLAGLLAKLRVLAPDVSFDIQELQTVVLLDGLRAGTTDVALLAQSFDARGLAGRDLVVEPFVLVAPLGHALAGAGPVQVQDLAGQSLILMQDGHCLRDQAIDVCARVGAPPPTSVSAASVSTLVRMVESGLGPTLLPASALAVELRAGQGLVARSFGASPPGRTVTLQWRASSPSAAWFQEIAGVLQAHYLSLNDTLPSVAGPAPTIHAIAP